jgi:small subunit ribosomal protein S15
MAKMHSRARGRSGSNRPLHKTTPSWTPLQKKELELLVVKLAKEGNSPSKIGLMLRDSYGIPDARPVLGKRVTELLVEKNLAPKLPEDLQALMRKSVLLRKHLELNRLDGPAVRGLLYTESKIKRLAKYYKAIKRLPLDWKYDPEKIKLVTE